MAKKTKKKASSTKRKTTRKTSASAKTSVRKKTVKKKAPASRKKTAKKAPAKKTVKKAPAKKTVKKKAPAKKTVKKAPAKKTTKKAAASKKTTKKITKKTTKKTARKSRSAREKAPPPPAITLSDARAAASKLASLAGLPSLKNRTHEVDNETEERERLTKSPLRKRELDKFRDILLQKRRDVAGDVTDMESEALGADKNELSSLPQHMADHGSDEYEQSLSLNLAHSQRELLKEIDAAIERIDDRTFGVCEAIGAPISMERLNATPWARYSLDGARMMDRGEVAS